MNSILLLQQFEVMNGSDVAASGRRYMLRPEQKSVGGMIDFVEKFSGPGDLVVNFCPGIIAVQKACLLLSEHRHFLGCQLDECSVKDALLGLFGVYTR